MLVTKKDLGKIEFNDSPCLVDYMTSNQGYVPLPEPKMANEITCPFCGCREYFAFLIPGFGGKRAWICKRFCSPSKLPNDEVATTTPAPSKRAILWPVWCQNNGVGDIHHNVRFEMMHQPPETTKFLLGFSSKPHGIVLMRGSPGTGKTYSCLAVCELFTRSNTDAILYTQKTLFDMWLQSFHEERGLSSLKRLEEISLLVIDDFGTMRPSEKFLEFFMNLINTRTQWTNRGTVITTNLDDKTLSDFFGNALADRIRTGVNFNFVGKSRRKETKVNELT